MNDNGNIKKAIRTYAINVLGLNEQEVKNAEILGVFEDELNELDRMILDTINGIENEGEHHEL